VKPDVVGNALKREQSFKVDRNSRWEPAVRSKGPKKAKIEQDVSQAIRQRELPVISGRNPCREGNNEGA
jgi:hypothetical protein